MNETAKENEMPVDPVLPHDLDDLYGPGAEDPDPAAASEWERKHYERKNLSVYEIYSELEDFLVSWSDDGDGYLQEAPEEVKAKKRQELKDIEKALELIYPFMVGYAEVHGLRVR
jgi:hypothetical protein